MRQTLRYLKDEDGASAAEYALILAIVGTAIAVAMLTLGNTIHTAVMNASNCIKTASTC